MAVSSTDPGVSAEKMDKDLSLYHLLDPAVLANPYPLYRRLRNEDPVHWDPFLHAWVVTRYRDVVQVLHSFSANRTPTPEQLSTMGLSALNPIAQVMVRQMLFLDPPEHTRLRALASAAFTPRRIERLRSHIQEIMDGLLDAVAGRGQMDLIADFASPAPAIVTAEMLGVPVEDHEQLKEWSADFAEMLGNFQHNPDRYPRVLRSVEGMSSYFLSAIREQRSHPREGLVSAMMEAEIEGSNLDWTLVRPPMLTDAEKTGIARVLSTAGGEKAHKIGRADLAAFIVQQLESNRYVRQAVTVTTT